jgi:hypothetical protein
MVATRKKEVDGKVTRSVYCMSSLIDAVEESSTKSGDKNFNREIVRLVKAQLAFEKTGKRPKK